MTKKTDQHARMASAVTPERILLLGDAELVTRLGIDPNAAVLRVEDWDELCTRLVREHPASLVLVDVQISLDAVKRLREVLKRFPSVTIIPVLLARPTDAVRLRSLLDAGASDFLDLGHGTATVDVILRSARGRPFKRTLEAHVTRFLDADARVLLAAAAEVAVSGGGVTELAGKFGVNPRTLVGWCARTALPEPRRLQAWMRVLLASQLLDDPGRTMWDVAVACGYSTDRSLRRIIKELLGTEMEVRALRRAGVFATAIQSFNAELRTLREDRRRGRSVQPGKVVVPMQTSEVCVTPPPRA